MPFTRRGRPGLLGSISKTGVITATAHMTFHAFSVRAEPGEVITVGSPPLGPDQLLESLNRVAALHDQGVLTDDEFTTAKSRLLAVPVQGDSAQGYHLS